MEFIQQSSDSLIEHCIHHKLNAKKENFRLIDSLTASLKTKDINLFLLGVLINRDKTPKNKIYREGREYKAVDNIFDVYFAITLPSLEQYAKMLRILCDFEEDKYGNRYRLLNSTKDLKDSILVEHFLKLKDNKGIAISTNAIFVRIEKSVETLQTIPDRVPVSDVKVKVKKRK